jgi:hypothetical protein
MKNTQHKNLKYLQSTEQQAIWISLMMWSEIIIIKDANPEHCVIGTYTHVSDRHPGD